ncbi:epididymal-specific lipocalin-8-like isoform X4 [Oryctolagus cuniculus]|uniref:epididymal-specific lipocalin-8-like isoform X4 n=1 Tax=Oryctolagus cuniculus TaxID=9986 RepID=UPI0038797815
MACVRSLSHGQPRWPHALTPHWLHIKAQAAREPGRRSRSTMEAGLLSALLGVLVVPWLQVAPVLVDLDRHKIAGFWREVGVASEQSLALNAPKRVQGLFLTVNGSSLVVRAAFNNSGSCETERIVGWEAGIPGKFTFPGHREILVLDTDYERYAIMRMSLLWQGRDFSMIKYLTRTLESEDQVGFWRFRELTAHTGLYLFARQGRCARLLKEVRPPAHARPPAPLQRPPALGPGPGRGGRPAHPSGRGTQQLRSVSRVERAGGCGC